MDLKKTGAFAIFYYYAEAIGIYKMHKPAWKSLIKLMLFPLVYSDREHVYAQKNYNAMITRVVFVLSHFNL